MPSFKAIFDAVKDKTIDFGVIPLENSLAGSIHENYDNLLEYDLRIVGEISGIRRRLSVLPSPLLLGAAYLAKGWGQLTGKTCLTPEWLFYFLEHRPTYSEAACADLGYRPRSLQQGLQQTLRWIHEQEKGPWHVPVRQHS